MGWFRGPEPPRRGRAGDFGTLRLNNAGAPLAVRPGLPVRRQIGFVFGGSPARPIRPSFSVASSTFVFYFDAKKSIKVRLMERVVPVYVAFPGHLSLGCFFSTGVASRVLVII